MSREQAVSTYQERIEFLEEFRKVILLWDKSDKSAQEREEWKSFINRNLVAARTAVKDAGTMVYMTLSPPPAVGGPIARNVDPFAMIFDDWYGVSLIPKIVEMVEQAIGVYEHLDKESGLVRLESPETIDIEAAFERALRPSFRSSAPSSEREVQDAVENILNSIGIEFVREREAAPVGPRAFHPDFTVSSLELAIEVKLASKTHGASAIQEEITADISAYRTKWKRLLVVIYDNGVIVDPYQMRRENMKHFGVAVVIVKH